VPEPPPAPEQTPQVEQTPNQPEDQKEKGGGAAQLAQTAKLFALRFLNSDFQKQKLTDDEVIKLDAIEPRVESKAARNFLAWRRALLWIAGVALGLSAIFSLFGLNGLMEKKEDGFVIQPGSPGIFWFISIVLLLAQAGGCYLAIQAAIGWTRVVRTRKFARLSWACIFVIPFGLGLIPAAVFVDSSGLGGPLAVGMTMGAVFAGSLLPMVFGLFPGLIRSSVTLKTLLPESTMPGWIAVVIAPIYSLFFLIALVISVQLQSLLLSIALGAFCVGPMLFAFNAKTMTSPVAAKDLGSTLGSVRAKVKITNLVGFAAILLLLIVSIKDFSFSGFVHVISFLASLISSMLLVTVACSDLLLSLFKSAFERESALRDGPLIKELESRFEELDEAGLTKAGAGEAELIQQMRSKFGGGDDEAPNENDQS
jgi:hypothetical protein